MDGVALAKAALLRGHLALITKDDGKFLNPSQCRDIVASLKTQGLLLESQLHGASANTRDQFAQAIEQWCSALQKQLGKTSLVCVAQVAADQTVHAAWFSRMPAGCHAVLGC